MKWFAIQYSEGSDLGRASQSEEKIRAAFAAIDPVLRERCRIVCLVEEEATAETLRPPAEDPFSEASFRATLETLRERDR